MDLSSGSIVKVNGHGDLAFDGDVKHFIGKECLVLWKTKSGLYRVQLLNTNDEASLPKRNLDLISEL